VGPTFRGDEGNVDVVPVRAFVLPDTRSWRFKSLDKIRNHRLIEERLEEQIGSVDYIADEFLHLLIAETREY
jgi:hypothetical protein